MLRGKCFPLPSCILYTGFLELQNFHFWYAFYHWVAQFCVIDSIISWLLPGWLERGCVMSPFIVADIECPLPSKLFTEERCYETRLRGINDLLKIAPSFLSTWTDWRGITVMGSPPNLSSKYMILVYGLFQNFIKIIRSRKILIIAIGRIWACKSEISNCTFKNCRWFLFLKQGASKCVWQNRTDMVA